MNKFKSNYYAKHVAAIIVLTLFLQSMVLGKDTLAPIYPLLLDHETRLSKVIKAYENPNSKHIFIAAHRGGRENDVLDQAPGNSIINIDNAVRKGFDLYESDIELLGDGTLVVFHDNDFGNLTNSNVANDLLENATLAYAKSLRLTYTDGTVSTQQIPTLAEFLSASKGKIMVKFDLKSGTSDVSTLIEILNTAVLTDTVEQVLFRGGENLLNVAANNGFDTKMIMRRYDAAPSAEDIESLTSNFDIRSISLPNGAPPEVINAANAAGLVVEVHESQDPLLRETSWQGAIASEYRQFHSFKPGLLLDYLNANGLRDF